MIGRHRKPEIYGYGNRTLRYQKGKGWVPFAYPKPKHKLVVMLTLIVGVVIVLMIL